MVDEYVFLFFSYEELLNLIALLLTWFLMMDKIRIRTLGGPKCKDFIYLLFKLVLTKYEKLKMLKLLLISLIGTASIT